MPDWSPQTKTGTDLSSITFTVMQQAAGGALPVHTAASRLAPRCGGARWRRRCRQGGKQRCSAPCRCGRVGVFVFIGIQVRVERKGHRFLCEASRGGEQCRSSPGWEFRASDHAVILDSASAVAAGSGEVMRNIMALHVTIIRRFDGVSDYRQSLASSIL